LRGWKKSKREKLDGGVNGGKDKVEKINWRKINTMWKEDNVKVKRAGGDKKK